jgi:hypothetical protein
MKSCAQLFKGQKRMRQMPDGNEHYKPLKHANKSPGDHTKFQDAERYLSKKISTLQF